MAQQDGSNRAAGPRSIHHLEDMGYKRMMETGAAVSVAWRAGCPGGWANSESQGPGCNPESDGSKERRREMREEEAVYLDACERSRGGAGILSQVRGSGGTAHSSFGQP